MADMDMLKGQIDNLNKKKADARASMDKHYAEIAKLQKQIEKLDQDIEKISGVTKEEVSAGDAATTTASLDAASTKNGGSWRYYPKIGDTVVRYSKKKKKKNTKKGKIASYINKVWDFDNDDDYDLDDFGGEGRGE